MTNNLSSGESANLEEALECAKKAVELCISIHGKTSMRAVDCYLIKAAILEKLGFNDKAEVAMRECLD